MSGRELRDRIQRRARLSDVQISPQLLERLEAYYRLLEKWNAKVNLTAFRLAPGGEDAAIDRLLLEPLTAARHVPLSSESLLDAGSGGGSPAIPLKLALPRLRLRMVESKIRKAVFLRESVRTLGIGDSIVETARFEELLTRPDLHEGLDIVTIRAVRMEPRVMVTLQAFLKPGGQLFLFRGSGRSEDANMQTPPLIWMATYPLITSLRSRLIVLQKVAVGERLPQRST